MSLSTIGRFEDYHSDADLGVNGDTQNEPQAKKVGTQAFFVVVMSIY